MSTLRLANTGHNGPDPPTASDERDVRSRYGHVLVPEPDLPVLHLHEPRERRGSRQPLRRALHALHVQFLRIHNDRLPGLRPVAPDGPVLHVLGILAPHDHLCGLDVGAAFEWNLGVAVLLLVLYVSCWWEWHRVGQQQDGIHILPHRHGEHAWVYHRGVKKRQVVKGLLLLAFTLCVAHNVRHRN